MSGYLGGDHCSINAQAIVDDQIALAISLLPSGEGTTHCLECGLAIPPARRNALPGVCYCIQCQSQRDKQRPRLKSVTKML